MKKKNVTSHTNICLLRTEAKILIDLLRTARRCCIKFFDSYDSMLFYLVINYSTVACTHVLHASMAMHVSMTMHVSIAMHVSMTMHVSMAVNVSMYESKYVADSCITLNFIVRNVQDL